MARRCRRGSAGRNARNAGEIRTRSATRRTTSRADSRSALAAQPRVHAPARALGASTRTTPPSTHTLANATSSRVGQALSHSLHATTSCSGQCDYTCLVRGTHAAAVGAPLGRATRHMWPPAGAPPRRGAGHLCRSHRPRPRPGLPHAHVPPPTTRPSRRGPPARPPRAPTVARAAVRRRDRRRRWLPRPPPAPARPHGAPTPPRHLPCRAAR